VRQGKLEQRRIGEFVPKAGGELIECRVARLRHGSMYHL
jgi:hypothetical protein